MRDLSILEKKTGSSKDERANGFDVAETASPTELAEEDSAFVLDLPHPNRNARNLFGLAMPIAIDALGWLPAGAALPDSWSDAYVQRFRMSVDTHVAWRPPVDESADQRDVVKQVSFLHASAGTDEETFRDHYRRHVELARRHMPALWQYVQNDVESAQGGAAEAVGVMAVSELWFRSTDDFLNRYFPSEADHREFSAQEGFLDLTKATSFICASHAMPKEEGR